MKIFSLLAEAVNRVNFSGSKKYWDKRYLSGGDSGCGSYGQLAEFKAEVINDFVKVHKIKSAIEFGCGDGNQLQYLEISDYTGVDISDLLISGLKNKFENDKSKRFFLEGEVMKTAELALSLDVIFHLVEDVVFEKYMKDLFGAAEKFVIIYSSDHDENARGRRSIHVRHRKFRDWIFVNMPEWKLIEKIDNRYPMKEGDKNGSFSDFYIYAKKS